MTATITRRAVLTTAPAALGGLLLAPAFGTPPGAAASTTQAAPQRSGPVPAGYPAQEPAVVREVVGVSHFDLERLRALVDPRPELSRAAWDWGFGDWETALGAASHVGRRDIAEYLIAQGARPDLFCAAMLGHLGVIDALVSALPGIQRTAGPHGITLLAHARAGGEPAVAVVRYLEALGNADLGPTDLPLTETERQTYVGTYLFGDGAEDRFVIAIDDEGRLMIERTGGTPRFLFNQGGHVFHPSGAPSARIAFAVEGGRALSLEVRNPDLVLRGRRG